MRLRSENVCFQIETRQVQQKGQQEHHSISERHGRPGCGVARDVLVVDVVNVPLHDSRCCGVANRMSGRVLLNLNRIVVRIVAWAGNVDDFTRVGVRVSIPGSVDIFVDSVGWVDDLKLEMRTISNHKNLIEKSGQRRVRLRGEVSRKYKSGASRRSPRSRPSR